MCMAECTQSVLSDFLLSIQEKAETPAALHLFKTNPKPSLIDDERKVIFHAAVAQLL